MCGSRRALFLIIEDTRIKMSKLPNTLKHLFEQKVVRGAQQELLCSERESYLLPLICVLTLETVCTVMVDADCQYHTIQNQAEINLSILVRNFLG